MEIKKIESNKLDYTELLLEADPEIEVVKKYIDKGDMYVLFEDDNIPVAEIIITKVNDEECELKNIATSKSVRGKGYAGKLISYVFEIYSKKYKRMIVGTTENMIPFYVLKGFNKYHHTVKNFFIDNYKEPIYDGELHSIDIYYNSKEFDE